MSRLSLIARSVFLIGFVVAMPLLALPSVSRQLDAWLYGHPKTPTRADDLEGLEDHPGGDGEVAQATFVTPLEESLRPRDSKDTRRGLDAGEVKPPPLASTPNFPAAPIHDETTSTTSSKGLTNERNFDLDLKFREGDFQAKSPQPIPTFDPRGLDRNEDQRLGQIRQKLEDLGADYIVLEAADDTRQFHFHCRMLKSAGSTETETFEASGNDAVILAEQVLKSVQSWRASQAAPR